MEHSTSPKGSSAGTLEADGNLLLACLEPEALSRIRPHLRSVAMQPGDVLYLPKEPVKHVYFPETSVICMLTVMEDGRSVESATVGREGASWISASVGAPSMPCQTMVSIGGNAQMVGIRYVEEEIKRNGSFHRVLTNYSHALLIQALRTGSCNALHSLEQRCTRWMLTTLDRTREEDFSITHEFLASLVGCARSVLSKILSDLSKDGGIELHRGFIRVVNRRRLELSCCECYGIIRQSHESVKHSLRQQ